MADMEKPVEGEEYEPDLITLEDENGEECTFEVIDAVDHKDVHYLALVPYSEDGAEDEDAQMIIMRVGTDDQGEYMDIVEEDDELVEISGVFEKRLREFYDIDNGGILQ